MNNEQAKSQDMTEQNLNAEIQMPVYGSSSGISGMQQTGQLVLDPKKVEAIVNSVDINQSAAVMAFGAKPMGEIARFADTLLSKVRAKDAGEVGSQLSELMMRVREYDPISIEEKSSGFLASLPVVGGLFRKAEKAKIDYQTLTQQVDTIATHLDRSMVKLVHDIETLEQLYVRNFDFYNDVSLYIEAGKEKLRRVKAQDLPALQAKADETKDLMDAQKVKDMIESINRFERRVHDLELSKVIAVQTAPQIRMTQSNNQQLAEKIQSSILSTLPIWKSQMVLALSLDSQKKAAQLQKDVSDTTNQMLRKNAEILQQSSIETATEVERSIVDIETLREVQDRLVNTIEETMKIASDARERRAEVEKELEGMEENLRLRLTEAVSKY